MQDVRTEIVGYFSSMLRVPSPQIAGDVHILELGVDSIMLMEAQRWLKAQFGCSIEVHRFFEELNTIDRIAAFVNRERRHPSAAPTSDAGVSRQDAKPRREELLHETLSALVARSPDGLMRSQLALVADVIEAQNRLVTTMKTARASADA